MRFSSGSIPVSDGWAAPPGPEIARDCIELDCISGLEVIGVDTGLFLFDIFLYEINEKS